MGGLIDYMEREPDKDAAEDFDTPVTGYGNEALWENQRTVPPAKVKSTARDDRSPL